MSTSGRAAAQKKERPCHPLGISPLRKGPAGLLRSTIKCLDTYMLLGVCIDFMESVFTILAEPHRRKILHLLAVLRKPSVDKFLGQVLSGFGVAQERE